MDDELADLEQLKKSGKMLDADQQESLTRLRKMVADYEWHQTALAKGKYPIGSK